MLHRRPSEPLCRQARRGDVGPTREAIDPVRYISNHSSGKQGHAIAGALARLGADVTLVSGPVALRRSAGRAHGPCRDRPTRCWPPASLRARSTSRSAPPPSPTGRRRAPAAAKIKKKAGAAAACARAGAQSRHSRHPVQARAQAAGAGGGLCRRDREPGRQRHRQAPAQGLRLDRGQRRVGRRRHVRRRAQHRASDQRRRASRTGRPWPRAMSPCGSPAASRSISASRPAEAARAARVRCRGRKRRDRGGAPGPRSRPRSFPTTPRRAAAGADLLAAIDQDIELGSLGAPDRADRHFDRPAGGLRGPGPAALRAGGQARRHGGQRARHHRCRLSRRDRRDPDQSRQGAVPDHARHANCTVGGGPACPGSVA